MKPLEMCVLPNNSDMIDPYINGSSIQLENSAFLSNDRKQKYMITKNNRGNIKNLRDQIKKQCP